jgi:large subunit ribosomal protein L10
MVTQQKEENISILSEKFKNMDGLILINYQGLKVNEVEELRGKLKKVNSQYMVVKNTLASLALKKIKMDSLAEEFSAPTAVLIIKGDVVTAAKRVADFSKEHEKLKVRSGHLFGKTVSADEISKIASLPTKEVLLGKFAGVLNMSLSNLVSVLQAPIREFVYTLDAISKKQKGNKEG